MRAIWLVACLVSASPIAAQPSHYPDDRSTIIVEGIRNRERQVDQFVNALTKAPMGQGQLSRYEWDVCPAVVGLAQRENDQIRKRMLDVAAAVGMNVAPERCAPNALVVLVDDQQEFIEALYRKHPNYFRNGVGVARKPRIKPGAVSAWHIESILDSNGTVPPVSQHYKYYILVSDEATRIHSPVFQHFLTGVVVIERAAVAGLTTRQVADYGAMRLFASTDPARLKSLTVPTILNVLDAPMGSETPLTLTSWDMGFLKSLYATPGRQFATKQRKQMQRMLRREIAEIDSERR